MLRPYEEQFDSESVGSIAALIKKLELLSARPTQHRLYTREVANALSVGLLLSAVSVSSSLLELFVRDLLVAHRIGSLYEGDMTTFGSVEHAVEEDRQFGFAAMLAALRNSVILNKDADDLLQFYERTRVPFAHGLAQRVAAEGGLSALDKSLAPLTRSSDLEDRLEREAIKEIQFVVDFMVRYRPWLVRRYEGVGYDE